jgi:NAD(P)-dependent dehydrogenase (short-subunit alcohol dehydrogenase family)
LDQIPDMSGKVCIVTGGNTGVRYDLGTKS